MEPLLHKGKEHNDGATVAQRLRASLGGHCCTKVKSIIGDGTVAQRLRASLGGGTVAQRLRVSLGGHCCTKVMHHWGGQFCTKAKSIIVEPLLHKG